MNTLTASAHQQISTSAHQPHQHISTSAHQHISTSTASAHQRISTSAHQPQQPHQHINRISTSIILPLPACTPSSPPAPGPTTSCLTAATSRSWSGSAAYVLARPEPQAIWDPHLPASEWRRADATFAREKGSPERGQWQLKPGMPEQWLINYDQDGLRLKFRLGLSAFKHVGLVPGAGPELALHLRADAAAPRPYPAGAEPVCLHRRRHPGRPRRQRRRHPP